MNYSGRDREIERAVKALEDIAHGVNPQERMSEPYRRAYRRYEIARTVLAALYSGGWTPADAGTRDKVANEAVLAADALLERLERDPS